MAQASDYTSLQGQQIQIQRGVDENGNPTYFAVINGQRVPLSQIMSGGIDTGDTGSLLGYTGADTAGADVYGAGGDPNVSQWSTPSYQIGPDGTLQRVTLPAGSRQPDTNWIDIVGPMMVGGAAALGAGAAGGAASGGGAGWTSGYDLAGGGALDSTTAAGAGAGGGVVGGGAGGGAAGVGGSNIVTAGDMAAASNAGAPITESTMSNLGNGATAADRLQYLTQNGVDANLARSLANSVTDGASWGKLLTSLGMGAASALGPNTSTTTNQSAVDPATQAYIQQMRDRATQLAAQPTPQAPGSIVTTPTTGMEGALSNLVNAGNYQAQTITDAKGLVGQGTTPVTSAANGLLGDVKAALAQASAPGKAAVNPYAGFDNPYTTAAIDSAAADSNRVFGQMVAPKFSQGNSFGSSGLAFAEELARKDQQKTLADMARSARMTDLAAQQQMGESAANRQSTLDNLIRQLSVSGAGLLGNLGESAAGRADALGNANANRYITGAGLLGTLSTLPVDTAKSIFSGSNALWNANNMNAGQQYANWQYQQEWPYKQQSMLAGSTGQSNTTSTSTTPNGNPWSRFAGGALAGMQLASKIGSWG